MPLTATARNLGGSRSFTGESRQSPPSTPTTSSPDSNRPQLYKGSSMFEKKLAAMVEHIDILMGEHTRTR